MMLYFGIPYPNIKKIRYRVLGWSNPYREKNYRNDVNQLLEDMYYGDTGEKIDGDFFCDYIPWNPDGDDPNDYIDVQFDRRIIQPTGIQRRIEAAGLKLEPAMPFFRGLSPFNYFLIIVLLPLLIVGEMLSFLIGNLTFDKQQTKK